MAQNLLDKGEQTCMMSLLTKDHKNWSFESGDPIPSRPVISGNTGLNCQMSELMSNIIEPITYEHDGRDVDSTDDMIVRLKNLNEKLSKPEIVNFDETQPKSSESEKVCVDPPVESPEPCKNVLSQGDIRNYGQVGSKTKDSSPSKIKSKLREQIEALQSKRSKGSIIPDMEDRMKAGKFLDKIFGDEAIPLPNQQSHVGGQKQKRSGLSIVGSDVKSLFPSLRAVETARLARCAILKSKVEFSNWDYQKALRYLFVVGGRELVRSVGLSRVCPKWLGYREDLLAVGGIKSREDKLWKDSEKMLHRAEMRLIVATVLEVAINLVMSTHVYYISSRTCFFFKETVVP